MSEESKTSDKKIRSGGEVVSQQPSPLDPTDIWLAVPQSIPQNVPRHLAHLLYVDSLVVDLRHDLIDEIISWSTPNCFTVADGKGKHLYYATESSDCVNMFCFGGDRRVVLHIFNPFHEEVIRMMRPISCACCRLCCPMEMKVFSPPEVSLGTISLIDHPFRLSFIIENSMENKVFHVVGPSRCRTGSCKCCNQTFKVMADNLNKEIAYVEIFQSERPKKFFGGKKKFILRFPVNQDVNSKALILGFLFFINYLFLDL